MINNQKSTDNMRFSSEYYSPNAHVSSHDLGTATKLIKAKMKSMKITQEGLSEMTGISQPQLSRLLRNDVKKVPQQTFITIQNALGLPFLNVEKTESFLYRKLITKLEGLELSGEVSEEAWKLVEAYIDLLMSSTVQSFPSIAYDSTKSPEYSAGPKVSGWNWYMRGLMNQVVDAGFNQHQHWNRFAVIRSTQKYINNKSEKDNETYAVGVTPLQDDMFKTVRAVSNPRTGGAYDSYEIKSLSERNGFSRDEVRFWLYYQKELSENREVHVMIQHHEPFSSSDVERFTRAVDEFMIQSEGEQRQEWRR